MRKIFILAITLLTGIYTNAQQSFTNNGNLQIHTGASVSGFGSFTNTSSGVLVNKGSFYIKGDISNSEASMANGTGTLYLNGSSAQSLNGTESFHTFNLVSDNSTGITLNNNLSISNTHIFSSGLITTSAAPNYLIYEAGSSYSGSTDASHVNGWVKKLGNTSFEFPVGNATYLRSVGLSSLSANSEFNARYMTNTPSNTQLQLPLININHSEYWSVNRVSGGTAIVDLNWDNSKVAFPNWLVSSIVAASWNGSNWINTAGSASGNTTTMGILASPVVSFFNLFTLASTAYPIPLKLVSFNATRHDSFTRIEWTTVSEQNVSHFSVERSDDGVSFYSIGNVTARNQSAREDYSFDDIKIINGTAWYRLRSVDLDGKENLSRLVAITIREAEKELVLVMNPVKDKILLRSGNSLSGNFDYQLWQTQGHLLQRGKIRLHNNTVHEIPFDQTLPAGSFILKVSNNDQSFQYKIVH